jgi:hypothetical protein
MLRLSMSFYPQPTLMLKWPSARVSPNRGLLGPSELDSTEQDGTSSNYEMRVAVSRVLQEDHCQVPLLHEGFRLHQGSS